MFTPNIRICFSVACLCLDENDGNHRSPRGRSSAVETKPSSRQLRRLNLEPDFELALPDFVLMLFLLVFRSARQLLSKGYW